MPWLWRCMGAESFSPASARAVTLLRGSSKRRFRGREVPALTNPSGHNGKGDVAAAVCAGFLALADEWIARAVSDNATSWFRRAIESVRAASDGNALAAAIGLAPRRLGRADLSLTPDDRARASALRAGLDPSDWSIDQLARSALMVASYAGDDAAFAAQFDA